MNRHFLTYTMAATLTLGFSSCALLNKDKSSSDTKIIPVSNQRESLHPQKKSSVYTPEELAKGIVKGDWAIETVNGKTAIGETAPYLKFDPETKKVYGSNGCNYLNADYYYNPADSTLSFSNEVTTMKACGTPGITDYEINAALSQVRKYDWEMRGSEYFLRFFSDAGNELMSLMHQNFQFLNGTWIVESLNNKPINTPGDMKCPDMKIVIDIDEGKVHGNTGCNILNGHILSDMELPNCISFEQLITTRMACPPDMNYESDLLVALEEVYTARPTTKDKVDLIDSHGQVVLTLARATSDK